MSYRVVYLQSVLDNLAETRAYLEREGAPAATTEPWFDRLFEKIANLALFPKQYKIAAKVSSLAARETRVMPFGDYLIFYQIDEEDRCLRIVAFTHAARRGRYE